MPHAHYRLYTLLALCLLLTLNACSNAFNSTNTSPTYPNRPGTTPSVVPQHVLFDLGIPKQALQTSYRSTLPGTTPMHVVVTFKLNATLLAHLSADPRMRTGQSINVASLANQVGITNQTYQQMRAFFGGPGITLYLNKLHTSMTIDGQASDLARQLHTQFVYYEFQGVTFYAPTPTLVLPGSIASTIQAISGLDSYSKYQAPNSATRLAPLNSHVNHAGCVSDLYVFTPQQISQAYGLNRLYQNGWTGQGTTIVLPEFSAFSRSDVQHYLGCVGFRGKLSVVTVDNQPPTTKSLEPELDIEMAAGLAPDANIVVYQANAGDRYENFWPKFQDVFARISDDYSSHAQPVMVSVSWGDTEGYLTYNMLKSIDSTLETLTTVEHVNVFAASGDCGAYDSHDYPNTLNVGFPGSDPYVIGVGGTFLYVNEQNKRTREVSWDEDPKKHPGCDNSWGSGGGLSSVFPRPAWQQGYPGIQNKYSNKQRQIPDVSAVAYYLSCYIQGQWNYCAGTSAAAPIWASGYALVNQGLASATGYYIAGPGLLYTLARQYGSDHPFYDVQSGNNLYYPATAGWDYATGLGTPNMASIYQGLVTFVHSLSS